MVALDYFDEASETIELFGAEIGRAMSWPPMAGRMFATLMLHDRAMTTDELQEALKASSGAISQVSRLLIKSGVVSRIKTPGYRKKSYAYREDAWLACIRHTVEATMDLLELAEAATESSKTCPPQIRRRFEEMRDFYTFMTKANKQLAQDFQTMIAGRAKED